jgi:hypothetical protein
MDFCVPFAFREVRLGKTRQFGKATIDHMDIPENTSKTVGQSGAACGMARHWRGDGELSFGGNTLLAESVFELSNDLGPGRYTRW